jgi:hypothetical protein
MLGKNKKYVEWRRMPAQDKVYLITAYQKYESFFRSPADCHQKVDDFQGWLLKRGVKKQLAKQNLLLT